ncbi:MAG: DUF4360 domain-containing protein [Mesorhizobium sp.]
MASGRVILPAFLLFLAVSEASGQETCVASVPTVTPDGATASVFFDSFSVSAGSGGVSTDTRTCGVVIPVQLPSGSVGIYKIDYRGGVELAAAQIAHFTVTPAIGSVLGVTFQGENQGDFLSTQLVGSGRDDALFLNLMLDLEAQQLGDAFAGLDSADVTTIDYARFSSIQASIDKLASERTSVAAHLGGTADLLLGFLAPVQGENDTSLLASGGSPMIGAKGHYAIDDSFSLLAGAAYVHQSAGGADANGPLLAGALRYVQSGTNSTRPFAEGGMWGAPEVTMRFSRQYQNRAGAVASGGDASGSALGIYARAGVIYTPNAANEFSISGGVEQGWLRVGSYAETGRAGNLFTARIGNSTSSTTSVKATAAWTTSGLSGLDMTLSAALGRTLGSGRPVSANVDWVGPVEGRASDFTFFEYGARVGLKFSSRAKVDAFVFGTAGHKIGTNMQYGAALKLGF